MAKYIQYGTKIYLVIRNPIKRYISAYYHSKKIFHRIKKIETIDRLIDIHSGSKNIVKFNTDLMMLHERYLRDKSKKWEIFAKVVQLYQNIVYMDKQRSDYQ